MSNPQINPTAASLLGFLHTGPMTGWELDAAVEGSIANFWNVTRSQVYRELRTLAELGYVEAKDTGPRDRQPFAITESGRAAFADWIVRDPGPPIVRMPLLLTVFFGRHLPDARLAEIVEKEIDAGAEALRKFETLHGEYDDDPFVGRVLQFGIEYQKTLLAWLRNLQAEPAANAGGAELVAD
jgi:DNA-binding PadR family transcriptional regulator